jgi:hypothetical protein
MGTGQVLESMKAHAERVEVVAKCCEAIEYLSDTDANLMKLVSAGACQVR